MDPETAVDMLKEATQEAEHQLDAGYPLDNIRDVLDEAGEAQDNLSHWISNGGFRPRRYETWLRRYVNAEKRWSAASKRG